MADTQNVLHMNRVVGAPPAQTWEAWTDPAILARWWWPDRFQTTYDIDLRPGGTYHYRTADVPGIGVLTLRGIYREVDPPRRLAYSWDWKNPDESPTQVTAEFVAHPAGTEIRLVHEGFASADERDNHMVGWTDCLDRLAAMFSNKE